METIKIVYYFIFPDGIEKSYVIEFDKNTLIYLRPKQEHIPDWAKLKHHQCLHCPLKLETSPYCPVAENLSHLVEFFKDMKSFSEVTVRVITEERDYIKKVLLQNGVFSAFGLIMSLSECPYTDFLKPMARFHLPFSSAQETIVRSVSFYLLSQYFVAKNGTNPDLTLTQLEKHYEQLKKVNLGIINRIHSVAKKDTDVNAVIILHSFADLLTLAISNDLSSLQSLFTLAKKEE